MPPNRTIFLVNALFVSFLGYRDYVCSCAITSCTLNMHQVPSTEPGLCDQVNVQHYAEWIELVANFTVQSLNSWQWAAGRVYYLLALWSRLVTSMPYLKGDTPSLMETNVPKIVQAYLNSRWAIFLAVSWWNMDAGWTSDL